MKSWPAVLLVVACGGPTQQQLAETPAARNGTTQTEAPAASTSDRDRERLNQQFDDMNTTQRAYREAEGASAKAPQGAGSGSAAPVKKGPAEEAPKQ